MDPLTGAIVGAVLFWFLKELVGVVIIFVFILIGGGIGALLGSAEVGAAIGTVVGWLGAIVWTIFAIVQTIAQIVLIVQLAAG